MYIFWNFHEPVEGQFDFSGRGNLTLFMAEAASAGIFVNLRIGPCEDGGCRGLHLECWH